MKRLLAVLLIAPLAACGDGPDMDFSGEDIGEDRFAVLSENGGVRMGLTDEYVYFALSDSILAAARAEMEEEDTVPREGIGGAIAGLVRGGVNRALHFRARYRVEEIRDIRWEDGRMVIEFEDPDRSVGDNFQIDDQPVEEAYREADVRAFAEEFRKVKR